MQMPDKKYRHDELQDMLQDVASSAIFKDAIAEKKRMTIIEFLAIVASEMKTQEKDYQDHL